MTVRQIATDYPGCREVFVRYGERADRATKFGHLEPLGHFARRCGVELDRLLAELSAAAGVGVDHSRAAARRIHRPFVVWALAITLTLGAGWGAGLLFQIGLAGDFSAVPASYVVAHGETQLWGFLALFIVGIASSYLPRISAGPAWPRLLSRTVLVLFLIGVGSGFVWSMRPQALPWLGAVGSSCLLLASLLYLVFLLRHLLRSNRTTWARFILASGIWLVYWAFYTLALRLRADIAETGTYSDGQRLILVELAVFGFAINSIYGFGQKLLSGFLGMATPRRGFIEACFWLHFLGLFLLVDPSGVRPVPACLGSATLLLAAACYATGMRGFRRVRHTPTRPELGQRFLDRYVQAAFFWLLAGLLMLLGGALWQAVEGRVVPHPYLGAIRHALTVGFMTTLILGVGQRLLPVLEHSLLAWPQLAAPIFLCIAVGNLLRVVSELATMFWASAFVIMPISSILELAALALFTANVLRTLWPAPDTLLRTGQVTARTPVAVLLAERPWLEDHLFAWGIVYVGRVRSVPSELTLGTLAASEGKTPADVVARINDLLRNPPTEERNT